MGDLKRTPLYDLHLELGARMVPFAGYEMPVNYPAGVLREHLQCRDGAALFDVSHMGQIIVQGADAALRLETLVPADLVGLAPGRQRYGIFPNDFGGIEDDLMIAARGDHLFLVVNASRKTEDVARLRAALGDAVQVITDRALLALQGPGAETALARLVADVGAMRFMDHAIFAHESYGDLWISRGGYTGEDGFEISLAAEHAVDFARALLAGPDVAPAGLGARDSLRLEAGLCLYGQDIDATTTPAEAAIGWAIPKLRRRGGVREGGFPGAERILAELADGPARLRVGLRPEGRAPMRGGVELFATDSGGSPIGTITSGGFGPSVNAPIAMGYVSAEHAAEGGLIWGELRGKRQPLRIVALPFHPLRYKR
ncbi:MAG: glycine cleavage system aminomethyltransferase GcvT [Paracoccaceae bacterium]